jgi:hypothetical protein
LVVIDGLEFRQVQAEQDIGCPSENGPGSHESQQRQENRTDPSSASLSTGRDIADLQTYLLGIKAKDISKLLPAKA